VRPVSGRGLAVLCMLRFWDEYPPTIEEYLGTINE
jgi:hypothetical protein